MMASVAVEARNIMAKELRRVKATVDTHMREVEIMGQRMHEWKNKKIESDMRHDEMFNSVT